MKSGSRKGRPIGEWQAENVRLTAFLSEAEDRPKPGAWSDLVGTEPEAINTRPREGAYSESGPYMGGLLTLEVTPSRIDWRLSGKIDLEMPQPHGVFVGEFSETRDQFVKLMKQWLRKSPPLTRLAFGAVLLTQVTDRSEGYKTLQAYLPAVKIDPGHSRDFSYQINRRRISQSGVKDLEINRLSRWSVGQVNISLVEQSPGMQPVAESKNLLQVCRLELDINTAPEFVSTLKRNILTKLYQELVDLGTEISVKGDVV